MSCAIETVRPIHAGQDMTGGERQTQTADKCPFWGDHTMETARRSSGYH